MPQTMQLATALRNQPLNELNAIRTGSQVTNPSFENVAQQANTQGPDLLGAANAQYGASADQYNARMGAAQGLMNLGSSYFKGA
jgi:hypothetical protein